MPVSAKYSNIPVALIPYYKSKADEYIRSIISNIKKFLDENGFKIKYKASDGDSGYNVWHNEALSIWWKPCMTKGFEAAIASMDSLDCWPISDF